MPTATETIEDLVKTEYKYGFVTDVETESTPPGLSEDTIRLISRKKNEPEWLLDWRLKAFRHWLTMPEPTWQFVKYPKIDFQDITYFSQPKPPANAPKSLADVDPKLLETYEKLGIPLREHAKLAGVAVDAIFDSVSVGTTFRKQLAEKGVIFCSFTEAVHDIPNSSKNISARSCRTRTIITPRSIPPSSPTARFATSRKACAARWSFPLISASTPRSPASSSARSSSPTKARTSATSKAAPRRCAMKISCTPPWWNSSRWTMANQIFDRAKLVSRRRKRQGRHLQFRDQARQMRKGAIQKFPGRRSRPARPSPGNIRAAFCSATIPWANFIPSP
jgi:hypothetical protein